MATSAKFLENRSNNFLPEGKVTSVSGYDTVMAVFPGKIALGRFWLKTEKIEFFNAETEFSSHVARKRFLIECLTP